MHEFGNSNKLVGRRELLIVGLPKPRAVGNSLLLVKIYAQ